MIEQNLLQDASNQLMVKMIEMGADPESEEFKQQMSPENIKTLPEIEDFLVRIIDLW